MSVWATSMTGGDRPVPADDMAAKALAAMLAKENGTHVAVAVKPDGDYVVCGYRDWQVSSQPGGRYRHWRLCQVAWASS